MELVKTDKEKNVIKPPLFTNTEKKKKPTTLLPFELGRSDAVTVTANTRGNLINSEFKSICYPSSCSEK